MMASQYGFSDLLLLWLLQTTNSTHLLRNHQQFPLSLTNGNPPEIKDSLLSQVVG